MTLVEKSTLIDIIDKVESYSDGIILFVEKNEGRWSSSSTTFIYDFDECEQIPIEIGGVPTFLGIESIKEVIDVWNDWSDNKRTDLQSLGEAIIQIS